MSNQSDYSPDEWQALVEIPTLVGAAVMVAGESGAGTVKEAHALVKAVFAGGLEHPDNELVRGIVAARVGDDDAGSVDLVAAYLEAEPDAVSKKAIAQAGYIRSVLERQSTAEEAAGFKGWLLDIGQAVAEAAREGGILKVIGLGSKVSKEEQQALDALKNALGA